MISKEKIRRDIIRKRSGLSSIEISEKSRVVCDRILSDRWYKSSDVIYGYYPVKGETDITDILNKIILDGKTLALPVTKNKTMAFYTVENLSELSPGAFGIPEPAEYVVPPDPDLVLVPGVAFAKTGDRIGYGGGFYDRFFSGKKVKMIGVCYDFQIFDEFETNQLDVKVNKIISDGQNYEFT